MDIRSLLLSVMVVITLSKGASAQEQDSIRARAEELKTTIEGMQTSIGTVQNDVADLKKFKVGGYIQLRFDWDQSSISSVAGVPLTKQTGNKNQIAYFRRARVKFDYDNTSSKYRLYLNASRTTGVEILEAYADWLYAIPARGFPIALNMRLGQQNWAFGYEIEYSSSSRDFPERSLIENELFNGERDRGVNLNIAFPKYVQMNIGVWQGTGIKGDTKNPFLWMDPTKKKDIIGRIKVNYRSFYLGFSGYWGKYLDPGAAADPGVLRWTDTNHNNGIDSGEVAIVGVTTAKPSTMYNKMRTDIDAQAFLNILPFGGTGLRGEYMFAHDKGLRKDGWYLWLSQSLTTKFGGAVRYQTFDPNKDNVVTKVGDDKLNTVSVAFHYFWDTKTRITLAYDINKEPGRSAAGASREVKNNLFAMQWQFSF